MYNKTVNRISTAHWNKNDAAVRRLNPNKRSKQHILCAVVSPSVTDFRPGTKHKHQVRWNEFLFSSSGVRQTKFLRAQICAMQVIQRQSESPEKGQYSSEPNQQR